MNRKILAALASVLAIVITPIAGVAAQSADFETAFDRAFGTESRAPQDFAPDPEDLLLAAVAQVAEGSKGRIGVAAIDLGTGREIAILGDQRFPMASTSKIAIAATFLEGVDQGRWSLTSTFPLLWAVRSQRFSSAAAPVRAGERVAAIDLIDLMITRSSNPATDALLAAVGGPEAVNAWARRAGIEDFQLSRDIATLVRDDGEFDPVEHIDERDSATPRAMVQLLSGIYQGKWISASSRAIILDAMERCRTGRSRIPALMPENVKVAHKTGTLSRTASDIGFIELPDGRTIAMAIYVTGQSQSLADEERNKRESRRKRDDRIATIARAIHDGYTSDAVRLAAAPTGRQLMAASAN